jgi:hypothetical protein
MHNAILTWVCTQLCAVWKNAFKHQNENAYTYMLVHADNGIQCASCFFFKLLQTAYSCFKAVVSKLNMWITAKNYNIFVWVLLTFLSPSLLPDIHFTWPITMQLKSFGSVFTNHFPFKGWRSKHLQQTAEGCFSWKPTEQQHHSHRLCEFGLKWHCHTNICHYRLFLVNPLKLFFISSLLLYHSFGTTAWKESKNILYEIWGIHSSEY